MFHDDYNLFLISEGLNDLVARPIQIFISENYEMAKLYFRSYIDGQDNDFNLYQIGTLGKNLKLSNKKVFIDSKRKKDYSIKQQKLDFEYLHKNQDKTQSEIIEYLFNGKKI